MRKKRQADVGWGEPEPEQAEPLSMGRLLAHQWKSYPAQHRSKASLALHAVAIPVFWSGLICVGVSLFCADFRGIGVGLAAIGVSMAMQGIGHSREGEPAEPYGGVVDMLSRVVLEQFVSFPRYVLGGGFFRAWLGR